MAVFLLVSVAGLAADLWSKHAVFESLLGPAVRAEPQMQARAAEALAFYQSHRPANSGADDPEVLSGVLRSLGLRRRVGAGLRFTLSTNPGVVFGLSMPRWAVWLASAGTMVLVVYFFACSAARARWVHLALAAILAGAIGNLYDRLFGAVALPGIDTPIRHQVRDFIDFSDLSVFGLNYPYIFNIADVLLVVGVAMLVLHWWFAARAPRPAKTAPANAK